MHYRFPSLKTETHSTSFLKNHSWKFERPYGAYGIQRNSGCFPRSALRFSWALWPLPPGAFAERLDQIFIRFGGPKTHGALRARSRIPISMVRQALKGEGMNSSPVRCLLLACGNTLRSDDGVGPWLAAWAEERFRTEARVSILSRQQWTPELAQELLARSPSFLSIVRQARHLVQSACFESRRPSAFKAWPPIIWARRNCSPARELYASLPSNAQLLTVGAGSTELGEEFSDQVKAALPAACTLLKKR